MGPDERHQIAALARGRVQEDVPLARFSTYRVGGPADLLVEPADADDLAALLPLLHSGGWPLLILGGGSNLLIADEGLRGVAIRLSAPAFQRIEPFEVPGEEGPRLRVGGGVRVSRLMGRTGREGWSRLTFLEGIPGTVGGCVRMNAGTAEGEIKDVLCAAELVGRDGSRRTLSAADCGFAYRRSELPAGAVVTEATLSAGAGDPGEIRDHLRDLHTRRKATQPVGTSGGSVFKNPPGDHAGRLIDAAGLKGSSIGGARVSEIHANFIRTEPDAKAADVRALMRRCAGAVKERLGVELELENILVGFDR